MVHISYMECQILWCSNKATLIMMTQVKWFILHFKQAQPNVLLPKKITTLAARYDYTGSTMHITTNKSTVHPYHRNVSNLQKTKNYTRLTAFSVVANFVIRKLWDVLHAPNVLAQTRYHYTTFDSAPRDLYSWTSMLFCYLVACGQ